ncbi:peptidoglycan bridge formation glycyltransferase FemA/FemB family protein [bacterium]|nr:peptidoglycan bridge formation glycyltransferase FemA/FemB family protein [bacterium]
MSRLESKWISYEDYSNLMSSTVMVGASVYHTSEWLLATASAFGCELKFVVTCLDRENLSVTPFLYKRKGPFRLLGSPLRGTYTEFSGPVFSSDYDIALVKEIMVSQHQLFAKSFDYIEVRFREKTKICEPLSQSFKILGYGADHASSLLVDLSQGEEDLWKSFVGRARTAVRKAEKADLKAKVVVPSQEWITQYYSILSDTFARQGLAAPHPLCFFLKIEKLSKLGLVFCVESRIDNKIGAAAIFVKGNHRMMYLSGVATKEGMRYSASSLVQWEAMKQGIREGITEYDMGGLGITSIDKFKRSFGGVDVRHQKWVIRSKTFRLIEPLAIWLAKRGWIGLN